MPRGRLIAALLLVGLGGALTEVERVAGQLYARLLAGRPSSGPIVRTSRDAKAIPGTRATGFWTAHVIVPASVSSGYDPLIERYSTRFAVRSELVRDVIHVESVFGPAARSPVGAMGLMQLMPHTAAELGVTDPCDPADNLRGGITYLKQLLT